DPNRGGDPNPKSPEPVRKNPNPFAPPPPRCPRRAEIPSPLRWGPGPELLPGLQHGQQPPAGGYQEKATAASPLGPSPFSLTLLLLLAEMAGRLPSRRDIPLVHAMAAAMACTAAAVIWSMGLLRDGEGRNGRPRALQATAAASSCLAALLYSAEVIRDRAKPGQTAPYLATPSGLLKVAETFLALSSSSALAAEHGASSGPEAWRWCLGIYCVSFALGGAADRGVSVGLGVVWLEPRPHLHPPALGGLRGPWGLWPTAPPWFSGPSMRFGEEMGGPAQAPLGVRPQLPLGPVGAGGPAHGLQPGGPTEWTWCRRGGWCCSGLEEGGAWGGWD
ncbi:uncharacterized protein LJ264_016000, partial [Porphyrio hochstetteri]